MSNVGRGKLRQYFGETSRSGYQRDVEHWKEIEDGISTHPLVIHYLEEHRGRKQEAMMRISSTHLTLLDTYTTESAGAKEDSSQS